MDKLHQDILKRLRKNIVADMDVYNAIINPLMSEYILKQEDVDQIKSKKTKQARAELLLDILPSRGPYAFDSFHQALKKHYWWLSEDIDKLLSSHGATVTNDLGYNESLSIPPVSPLTVTRKEEIKKLKNALEKLKPGGYIVLHGMKGFGKSCLTASTLKDIKLVKHLFHNKIYWIKFGYERSINEEILIQLNTLYHLVKNIDIIPGSNTTKPYINSFVCSLQQHFNKPENSNALLILDDVCDKEIIDTFNFNCKTLVITADIAVLEGKQPSVIKIHDGFTEAETLGLFAEMLDIDVNRLPPEAKQIHKECKGMPLLISMFAAQFAEFKEDMNSNSGRWKHYLDCLRKKDTTNRVMQRFLMKQTAIFNMCINQLPPEVKRHYEDLAIFSEDVNIMPKTLEILWEGDPYHVEEIMLDLCHKSLAAKQWNNGLKSYIYGVHDLLLSHLRTKFTTSKLTQMHNNFIEKYRKSCNGDFSKLPEDNYIYSYIGHHLEQAKLYDEFSKLYLDLDFIQAKIEHTGLNDLLIDLKKYRKYITKNYDNKKDYDNEYEKYVNDLEDFLESEAYIIAKHRRRKCLDLIQIIMNNPHPSHIKTKAEELAKKRSTSLFVLHEKMLYYDKEDILTEEISTEISTSSFTNDPDVVVIGNQMGEIIVWNSQTKKQEFFSGHTKKCIIKKICVSKKADCFLSLSDNGVVKLFQLYNESSDEDTVQIHSPRQKQSFWEEMHNKTPHDDSIVTFSTDRELILDVIFIENDSYVAACTDKGSIYVWDIHGNISSRTSHNFRNSFKNIAFTIQGAQHMLLHTMDEVNGVIVTYKKSANEYIYVTQYNPQLQGKKIIFFHHIPGKDNYLVIVTEDKIAIIMWYVTDNDPHSFSKRMRGEIDDNKSTYLCAAITLDGRYLVSADTLGFIYIWTLEESFEPIAVRQCPVISLDTYWQDNYHIICGCGNGLLHKWVFPIETKSQPQRNLLFDAIVQPFSKTDIVAKETSINTITISNGIEEIIAAENINDKIVTLKISPDGKKIMYATDKGIVTLFNVNTRKSQVFQLPQATDFIQFLYLENEYLIVCREQTDCLKVWLNEKVDYIIEKTGYVTSIYNYNEKFIISISRDGRILLWDVGCTPWYELTKEAKHNDTNVSIHSTHLSDCKRFLVVLNGKELILYILAHETDGTLNIQRHLNYKYAEDLTCCKILQNGQYLAVGLKNGDISIIDISLKGEIYKFSFHESEVTQLHWASINNVPLLLSVNNDEMALWNISLIEKTKQKRSRLGIHRSISTPCVSKNTSSNLHIPNSQSASSNMCNIPNPTSAEKSLQNGSHNTNSYWKYKRGKDSKRPELLTIVPLPAYAAKVCVSDDFTKYVTVDFHGSISTFKLFEYTE